MASLSSTIKTLPGRALSSNGNKRNHHEVSAAKMELAAWANTSAHEQLGPVMPVLNTPVDIAFTFFVKHHAKTGDGLYRPLDPSNIGGECIKPIVDYGLVKTGIIPDDSYLHVRYVVLAIEHVDALADERIDVTVMEVE